jgi:uncharacterized protein (DUF1697 family)
MALVVFLRGCNVGGHRTFRPTRLAEQLKSYDAVNVGAAGTFVIRRRTSRGALRTALLGRLPFGADVMICDGRDLIRAASVNPFAGAASRADVVRFVSVLAQRPRRSPAPPISLPERGRWVVRILAAEDRFVFGLHRRQMNAIGYLGEIDRLFGSRATTRSWSTITKIIQVLKE